MTLATHTLFSPIVSIHLNAVQLLLFTLPVVCNLVLESQIGFGLVAFMLWIAVRNGPVLMTCDLHFAVFLTKGERLFKL